MDELHDNESLPTVEVGIDYAFTCVAALCRVLDTATNRDLVAYQRAKAAYTHLVEKINEHDRDLIIDVLQRQKLEKEAYELMNPPNTPNPTVNTPKTPNETPNTLNTLIYYYITTT